MREIIIPENANGMNLLFSYKTTQHKPVTLYPSVVKVVMKNFNDNDIFSKGSPDVKIKIPASALRMRKIIIVTKKVFEIKILFHSYYKAFCL
jgi:hypothetical protein